MNFLKRKGAVFILCVCGIALLLRICMMVQSSIHIPVTSDESITILQAKAIASGQHQLFVWAQPYQFPVETYMVSPIVNLLPRNGFGARFNAFFISFLSMLATVAILLKMGPLSRSWVGIFLVLFPASYLLMVQCGYPHPHYTPAFLFWWIAIFAGLHVPKEINRKGLAMLGICGLFCGLAFTNNMISLAIVVPVAIVVCWGSSLKRFALNVPIFGASVFVGLLPYLVGIWSYPEAQAPVSGVRTASQAMARVWPALSITLPRALGIDTCLIPDSHHTLGSGVWFMKIFAVIFVLILLYGTILSAWRIIADIASKKWPVLTVNEIFIGGSWLGLMLFLLSTRADFNSYRYLSPTIWCFPFIVYYAYNGLPRRLRAMLGILVLCLCVFNIVASIMLMQTWKRPDYAAKVVSAPDLDPAIKFLNAKGIKYAYASHWAAYRLSFLTDEEIICSQPHNERFHNWVLPYKAEVDAATNIAYVLTEDIRFLKPRVFERHMRTMRVKSKKEKCGRFCVYYDFEREYGANEALLDRAGLTASASNNSEGAAALIDGDMDSFWRTDRLQEKEMQVEVTFAEPANICRALIYFGIFYNDRPEKMRLEVKTSDGWEVIDYEILNNGDKFRFENGHPVYGAPSVLTVMFDPVEATALRLVADEPKSEWAWTINELDIYKTERRTSK